MAGLNVCISPQLSADADGIRTFRETCLAIGGCFVDEPRALRCRVGMWSVDKLVTLPIFDLDEDGMILLKLSEADEAAIIRAIAGSERNNPFVFPLHSQPLPWKQIDEGGVSPGYFGRLKLI